MKYERHMSAGALAGGFVVDTLTFQRIDFLFGHAMLFAYLGIAALSIIFMNARAAGRLNFPVALKTAPFFPVFAQYAFGGLFSAFAIFYTKSASLAASWPFLLFIFALLLGNEIFRARYQRFGFQVTLFFIVLFSFLIFYLPVIVGNMSVAIFLLSGVISLVISALFVYMLLRIAPLEVARGRKVATFGIVASFTLINFMYFVNIIPPIPLALQDAGVYREILRRADGSYELVGEKKELLDMFRPTQKVSLISGEPLYFYSAVFAPTKLETTIVHRWQYFDDTSGEWVTASDIAFPISGGRGEGYRGYSMKTALFPGLWRVRVMTERGAVIGQFRFEILSATQILPLEKITL